MPFACTCVILMPVTEWVMSYVRRCEEISCCAPIISSIGNGVGWRTDAASKASLTLAIGALPAVAPLSVRKPAGYAAAGRGGPKPLNGLYVNNRVAGEPVAGRLTH
ncbi:hypothetical protein D9M71_693220 [compost metagenome]